MKFGQKQTRAEKVAVASRNKSGKAMDKKPAPKAKVKPTGNPLKGKVGFTYTQMLRGGMK